MYTDDKLNESIVHFVESIINPRGTAQAVCEGIQGVTIMLVKTETNQLVKVIFLESDLGTAMFSMIVTDTPDILKDTLGARLLKDLIKEAETLQVCFLVEDRNFAITQQTLNRILAWRHANKLAKELFSCEECGEDMAEEEGCCSQECDDLNRQNGKCNWDL